MRKIHTSIKEGNLASNKLPFPDTETILPLSVRLKEAGTYTISAKNFTFNTQDYSAYFEDITAVKLLPINANFSYTFASDEGISDSRFKIHLVNNKTATPPAVSNNLHGFFNNNMLNIRLNDKEITNAQVSLLDASGKMLLNTATDFIGGQAQLAIENLATGVYILNVKSNSALLTQKLFVNKQ